MTNLHEKCLECQGSKLIERKAMEEPQDPPKELMEVATKGERRIIILEALDRVLKRTGAEAATKKELAEELGMRPENLNNYLWPLEEEGFIVRTPGPNATSPVTFSFSKPEEEVDSGAMKEVAPPSPGSEPTPGPPSSGSEPTPGSPPPGPEPEFEPPPAESAISTITGKEIRLCKQCGLKPEKVDRTGRHMGKCADCLREQSRENLAKGSGAGWTPFPIPLNNPKYAEIRAWVEETAEELEQDLPRAVMYILKLAHRRNQEKGKGVGRNHG